METILQIVSTANAYLSDYILIILLIGLGLYFTIRTRCVQVRCFGEGMRTVFGNIKLNGGHQSGGMSSFQALATAVAAQVGTGNIVGACGAILIGGPGAIFWMWIIAFLGMATIYAEAVLAQKTRVIDENGEVHGGPVYYITQAFRGKFGRGLAIFFAIALTIALGFFGTMVQSNSMAEAVSNATGHPEWDTAIRLIVGSVVAILAALIFIGGAQRVAAVTEKMVPAMALLYILGGLVVICIRLPYVPETFAMIFRYAFQANALIGGGVGYAIKTALSQGAKRGLFSNEAGMGSTPHAHALAKVKTPHEQGVTAMIGVFIDTFVVLTMTALVVISTLYAGDGPLMGVLKNYRTANPDGLSLSAFANTLGFAKTTMAQSAFGLAFGNATVGNIFVAVCLFFFAFSTVLGWNLFGRLNVQWLFSRHTKAATAIYSCVAIGFIFAGALLSNDLVWELTDFFNYLMVIPNALALFVLGSSVVQEVRAAAARRRGLLSASALDA